MRRFQLQMIDGKELINFEWVPVKSPIAILQIVHNIDEHMSLYDELAKQLNQANILVIGTDLRSFGESIQINEPKAWLAKKQGWNNIIEDIRTVNTFIRRKYKDLPIFMLGQTIGADFVLAYAIKYSETFQGMILSGTKSHNHCLELLKTPFLSSLSLVFNQRKPASFLSNSFTKQLDNHFLIKQAKNNRRYIWLSTQNDFVQQFTNDELCAKVSSYGLFKDINVGQRFIAKITNLNLIEKDLPITILSGDQDAYGNFAKSPRKLFNNFIKLGNDVDLIIYSGSRNRIFKDKDKDKCIKDIITFINKNKEN